MTGCGRRASAGLAADRAAGAGAGAGGDLARPRRNASPEFYEAEAAPAPGGGHLGGQRLSARARRRQTQGHHGSFQLVEGWVDQCRAPGRADRHQFRRRWRGGSAAIIAAEDRRAFRDFDLDGWRAAIRVRGIVQDYRGRPQIALSNPAQIEMLD